MNTKKGILKYIAQSSAKGCKFEDEPNTWYNPVNETAKAMIKDDYKGELVEITLAEGKKSEFSSMKLCEKTEGEPIVVSEENMAEEEQPDPELLEEDDAKEEKVPQTPPKEEMEYKPEDCASPFDMLKGLISGREYTCDVFSKMNETKVKIEKKGNLNYASWAEVWKQLKKLHPRSTYKIHENRDGMPYFTDGALGAFVKVSVTVLGITHTVHLPVMNHSNKAAVGAQLDVVLINKNIQRAFAKAIAMHGIGLYVYEGEDLPEDN